ncbi:hypothetical protein ACBI99_44675 [Nonomuraea sp. ATR24]|uniref:hypothetical protein n=1 Tax=Nonomuraea sp. ATR24 TaxID=1676744 RepID=UPI0035C1CCE6
MGQLVALIDADDKGFQRGVDQTEKGLNRLESSAAKSTARMESTVSKAFTSMARSASDALSDVGDQAAELLKYGEIDIEVDAEIAGALAALQTIDSELDQIDGRRVAPSVDVDLDTRGMASKLGGFAESVGGALAAAVRTTGGPVLIGALGGVAAVVGPAVGAAMGGAIVAGIGAKLTTLGVQSLFYVQEIDKSWSAAEKKRVEAANKQAKELQSQFQELARDLTLEMQDASQPLLSVLDEARVQAREVGKDIGPNLREGFEEARVPLEQFLRDAGDGLKNLGDSIPSLMGGFGDVLQGLDIKGLLSDLGEEFTDLGRIVSENRSTIGAVLNGLLDVIPLAVDGLGRVIEFFGTLGNAVVTSGAVITERMAGVVGVVTDVGTGVLTVVRNIGQALTHVPGMEGLGKKIVAGADAGIAKLREFKQAADEAARVVRLKADIVDIQQKLDVAMTLLDDPNLTKERRAQINAEIDKLVAAKGEALRQLGDPALIAEYKSNVVTDITALQSRLADARKELKDPELTKERKSALKAEIAQLQESVKRAKAALDSLQDKTVHVTTIYSSKTGKAAALAKASKYARGGIQSGDGRVKYMAAGGVMGGSSMAPPPDVASEATFLPHSNTVYGEAGREAFIPYASRYRSRAVDILGRVADDFGMELYSREAATRITRVGETVDAASTELVSGMDGVLRGLESTLGHTGSLTSTIGQVGEVGGQLVEGWTTGSHLVADTVRAVSGELGGSMESWGSVVSVSVSDMSESMTGSIGDLSLSVNDLTAVLAQAADAALSGGSSKPGGKKSPKGGTGLASQGSKLPPPPGSKGDTGLGSQGAKIGGPPMSQEPPPLDLSNSNATRGNGGVTVHIGTAVIREDADIPKIGKNVAFNVMARPF